MPASSRIITAALIACTAMATSQPGAAQRRAGTGVRVPDGQYKCQMWMGNNYVDLVARLSGGSAASSLLTKVGATITSVTPAPGGITINYTTARGYRESMDCKRA